MKVLFFDSWTVGIHNFLPLAKELAARGHESLLVHRGSWGDEPNRPVEEVIDGLLCRDIRYYRTCLLYKVLECERPDAVLILNPNTFVTRAVVLAACALGVRSYYLMHGIVFVGEKREADMAGMDAMHRAMRWTRASKYLHYILPNYFYSGWKSDPCYLFRRHPYWIIWKSFSEPARYYWSPPPHPELQCDQALVWADAYRDHFHKACGYPLSRIEVVGPPPLDSVFHLRDNPPTPRQLEEFRRQYGLPDTQPISVYLESPAVETNIEGWTKETRLAHLDEMATIAASAGRFLVLKLHPSSETESLAKFNGDPRIRFIQKTDLPMLVYISESVIGFVSSTLDIAVCLGKPVLTPTWGISGNLPRDFIEQEVAYECKEPEQLRIALVNTYDVMKQQSHNIAQYTQRFISKMDGLSVKRIVDALLRKA